MQQAIAVLRMFFGVVFLTNGLAKMVPGIAHLPGGYFLIDSQGAKSIIQHNAAHHPVKLYHDLVFNLLVPNWTFFAPLAAALSLHIQFSDANGPWLYEYAVEWVPLLCLVFMRSGSVWGLDGLIARSNPRWSRLFAPMRASRPPAWRS
jgi:hypothetical protein